MLPPFISIFAYLARIAINIRYFTKDFIISEKKTSLADRIIVMNPKFGLPLV
jgi:hypothetical protein